MRKNKWNCLKKKVRKWIEKKCIYIILYEVLKIEIAIEEEEKKSAKLPLINVDLHKQKKWIKLFPKYHD